MCGWFSLEHANWILEGFMDREEVVIFQFFFSISFSDGTTPKTWILQLGSPQMKLDMAA